MFGYMSSSYNQGNESVPSKTANLSEQVNFKEPEIISTTVVEVYSDNTPKVIMVTFKDNTKMWFGAYEGSELAVCAPREGKYFGEITIPSKVNINGKDYPVTSIAFEAFSGEEVTSVFIPNSVTVIYPGAFKGCTSLTTVYIPEGVKTIYDEAFSNCYSLTSITIPQSVDCILPQAFYGTAWYNSQPDGLIVIGQVAYEYKGEAPENTSIYIPNTVTSITCMAFADKKGITIIEIPSSVKDIGVYAFEGTTWFENQPDGLIRIGNAIYTYKGEMPRGASVIIPEGVTCIGQGAFYERYGMVSVTLPNSVTCIGQGAFMGCRNLASINIPEGVTCIDNKTFSGCEKLTKVTIPNSVTAIGDGAFWYCEELALVTIQNPNLQIDFEKVFKGCGKLQRSNVIYASGSGTANNPSSVSKSSSAKPKVYSNADEGNQFVVIDGSQLRLRLGPSTSSDTFKWPDGKNRHPNVGDRFKYLGESGDFYKIDFNGTEVWVSKQYSHIDIGKQTQENSIRETGNEKSAGGYENDEIYQIVEEMPSFPGGEQKLLDFLSKNTHYPSEAREQGIHGRVFVGFVVEPDGSISNVKLLRGIGGGCDEEAVRAVQSLPKWNPGKQKGKSVRVSYMLPINFN